MVAQALSPSWKSPFSLVESYRHDRLLHRLHLRRLAVDDVYQFLGLRLGRLRQKLYWGYLLGCGLIVTHLLAGWPVWPAVLWTVLCLAGIWWLHVRRMGKRALVAMSSWLALPAVALVPFVFMFSVMRASATRESGRIVWRARARHATRYVSKTCGGTYGRVAPVSQ